MNRPAASVAAYYDEWTARYLEHFGSTIQAHRPTDETELHAYLLRRVGIRDGKRVLDAGCGVCGPSAHFASQRDVEIDAVTISERQAEMARDHVAAHGLGHRVRVHVADFHDLPIHFERETFDIVYFLESLSHSPDPGRVLAGVFHVLKPGGIVYIKDFFVRRVDGAEEQQRILDVIERVDRLFAVKTPEVDDMTRALHEAGFLPVWVESPKFEVDNGPWQAFERANALDLFNGQPSFDWSRWLEFKYQKP